MLRGRVSLHAAKTPDRTAVVAGEDRLTYRELDDSAARLTASLRRMGVGPGAVVALYLPRTTEAVTALLGVLGSGAAYTIVEDEGDTGENAARLANLGADLVLTAGEHGGQSPDSGLRVATVSELCRSGDPADPGPDTGVHPDSPAYVLFTSGSTGVPKGVVVTHGNIRHYVESLLTRLEIADPLDYAHATTLSADLGNTCLFLPLWTGGTIHLLHDDVRRDPAALFAYLRTRRVDVLKVTPSYWSAVFRAGWTGGATAEPPLLRHLILGGERLTRDVAAAVLSSGIARTLVNHYGPTETTVGVAAHVLTGPEQLTAVPAGGSVPVGAPLGSTTFLLRTREGDFRSTGVGELYVGGPSVAAGYRGDPETTRAAFVTDPAENRRGRFYRTGDQVRIDADGVAEFLGRTDRQIKIHGYRVELEHVEAVLRQLDGVLDAAVFHLPQGAGHALVAAVAAPPAKCRELRATRGQESLRADAGRLLPRYMVPARIVPVDGEFPRNANGKNDLKALRRLVEAVPVPQVRGPAVRPPTSVAEPATQVRDVWRRYLGPVELGPDLDFFAAGGSSLDAIQVIADLQALGHRVTARSFLAEPTIRALATAIGEGRGDTVAGVGQDEPGRGLAEGEPNGIFSAAQSRFFDSDFADPDHWNQAILLQTAEVDPDALAAAVRDLVRLHPLLHTAFRRTGQRWRAEQVPAPDDTFSISRPEDGGELTEDELAAHVQQVAGSLHSAVDLAGGRVFKVHLFSCVNHPDQILFVCHHLCVDVVSWRILFTDLCRAYGARSRGTEPGHPYGSTSFWAWARHIQDRAPALAVAFNAWYGGPGSGVREAGATAPNLERDAVTLWTAFSRDETTLLIDALAASAGLSVHSAVLGSFLQALAGADSPQLLVDVESHGRASFDDEVDVSRVVGWFTSTYPLPVTVVPGDTAATVKAVATAFDTVPDLGIGHAFRPGRPSGATARICYNYLGRFRFGRGEDLDLRPSQLPIGPARGGANDRIHDLKLTGRIINGHLVLDLSFHPGRDDPATVTAVLRETCALLLSLAGGEPSARRQVVTERSSSSGLLAYAPRALRLDPPGAAGGVRRYRNVLLTGATGYIGVHLLRLLLQRTDAQVHCLVRGDSDEAAAERLAVTYRWYFPAEPLDRYADRLTVHAGDAGAADLGLSPETYRSLAAGVDAIYHLAADTRLFGSEVELSRTNVGSVRAAVQLAGTGRPKDLHYTSTLAVAGVNRREQPVRFAEDNLDIGQEFQNAYEQSKYAGEQLVHDFMARGGSGFIYRAGNVSGDSRDGRFQRNAGANRLIQTLRAVVRTGRLPRDLAETIVLSPVDTVAEGILAISLSTRVEGGTFHVDADHEVSYREIFDQLHRLGYRLADSAAADLAELLSNHPDQRDPDVALGRFWAGRGSRNVHFDRRRTLSLLADLGVSFRPPESGWLRRYLWHLAEEGHLGPRTGTPPVRP